LECRRLHFKSRFLAWWAGTLTLAFGDPPKTTGEMRKSAIKLWGTLLNRENVEQESYIAITLECRRLHFKSVLEVFVFDELLVIGETSGQAKPRGTAPRELGSRVHTINFLFWKSLCCSAVVCPVGKTKETPAVPSNEKEVDCVDTGSKLSWRCSSGLGLS
jgi:hypothetical protein